MIIIILIIKVDYNYHKNYPRIIWGIFLQKLYNFDNFIRRRLSDLKKITLVSLSPSLSPGGAFFIYLLLLFYFFTEGGGGKHKWHMIFLTFLRNWCFKNSMYLSTGLSIMTVNISWNFKERMVHKLPFFLGFSVVLANSCRGSLQKKDSLLFIYSCKGFLKCNYFRDWCIIYSRGNSFRNSHAFLTTR